MFEPVGPLAFDLVGVGGNDRCSSGLGILLRGGNFTISGVKEVVSGRLLLADITYRNAPLRLINVYAPAVKSERLAILGLRIFWSRVRSMERDVTCSHLFFLKESSTLSNLKEGDGSLTSSQSGILRISKSFYDTKPTDSAASLLFLTFIMEILDDSTRERLDQPISLDELTKALKSFE
eukprot:g23295.t1